MRSVSWAGVQLLNRPPRLTTLTLRASQHTPRYAFCCASASSSGRARDWSEGFARAKLGLPSIGNTKMRQASHRHRHPIIRDERDTRRRRLWPFHLTARSVTRSAQGQPRYPVTDCAYLHHPPPLLPAKRSSTGSTDTSCVFCARIYIILWAYLWTNTNGRPSSSASCIKISCSGFRPDR